MAPPEDLGYLEAAAPSAEHIGAPIKPPIFATDVVLVTSRSSHDGTYTLHILVPASPLQCRTLCGIRQWCNAIGVKVQAPVECKDWSGYMATQRAIDEFRPRGY